MLPMCILCLQRQYTSRSLSGQNAALPEVCLHRISLLRGESPPAVVVNEDLSQSVGALSPADHKGLHQGWTQTSLFLQVIHFKRQHDTSRVFCCCFFFFILAYLYSAGTQHGNLHPAGWPILFCRPTQEAVLATANTGRKKTGEVLEKNAGNGLEG